MKREDIIHEWDQLSHEFDESLDLEELASFLDEYTVDYPPEHVIETAIENTLPYVPRIVPKQSIGDRLAQWFHSISLQTVYLEDWFWISSLLLFLVGYMVTVLGSINAYKTVLLLSPIPFVLGIVEMLRSMESGMAEIELTTKLSLPQIVMTRFVLIGSYNIILNTLISLGLYWSVGVDLGKVVLFWVVPFTWISGVMLFLASRFRGRRLVPIVLLVWGVAIIGLLSQPKVLPYLLSINSIFSVLFGVLGVAMLWWELRNVRARVERGIFIEITD